MPILETMMRPEFEAKVVASTPRVLRHLLQRVPEVDQLTLAYKQGEIGSGEIRRVVNELLTTHRASVRFPFQVLLAAIAVALETRFDSFAEEFINDLANLRSDRFSFASRVARLSLESRTQGITNTSRVIPSSGPTIPPGNEMTARVYGEPQFGRFISRVAV